MNKPTDFSTIGLNRLAYFIFIPCLILLLQTSVSYFDKMIQCLPLLFLISHYLQNVNSDASTRRYLTTGTEVVENSAVFRPL